MAKWKDVVTREEEEEMEEKVREVRHFCELLKRAKNIEKETH